MNLLDGTAEQGWFSVNEWQMGFNLALIALHFGRPARTRRADSLHAMGLLADNGRSRMVGYEATKSWDGYGKELDLERRVAGFRVSNSSLLLLSDISLPASSRS